MQELLGHSAGEPKAKDPSSTGGLSPMLRRGAMISSCAFVGVQATSFLQTLVIARLLSPAEIGVYAAGTVLSGFLVTFSEGGLRAALIQREGDLENAADTVFWATIAGGLLMSLLTLAAAPLVAAIFDSRTAGMVAAVTSGTLLLRAFTIVPDSLMQRRFNFRRRLIVDPSIAVSFAVTSVALCLLGFGVWGLVIASYVSSLVWICGAWALAKWRPGIGRPSYRLWRDMAGFAYPLVLEALAGRVVEMIETVVVGRGLSTTSLGHYRYGRRLSQLPSAGVIETCSYVLFPAFSRISGDAVRLKRAFLQALEWIWLAAAPVAALAVIAGEPLVVVLLGERWRGAGVAFAAMAGFGLGTAMDSVSVESIKACGRSRLLNWLTLAKCVGGIGMLVLLVPFGLVGIGLAISAAALVAGVVGLGLARRVVGVSVTEVLGRMIPPVIGSLVAVAVVGPLEHVVFRSDERALVAGLSVLTLDVIAFLVVYLGTLRLVAPSTTARLGGAVRTFLTKRRRRTSAPPATRIRT